MDATPLFLMCAADYYAWTGDLETLRALRPALDAALGWIDEFGDRDGDGFIEYERRSPAGLRNQGWKDSHDSVVHADGSLAEGPIALVEAQGYVYRAKLAIADVYAALGDAGGRRRVCAARRSALREAFNEAFWNPDGGDVRAGARRTQAPGRERHLQPRPLPVLRNRRPGQGRSGGRAADGARTCSAAGACARCRAAARRTTR